MDVDVQSLDRRNSDKLREGRAAEIQPVASRLSVGSARLSVQADLGVLLLCLAWCWLYSGFFGPAHALFDSVRR